MHGWGYQLLDGTFPDENSAVMEAYIIKDRIHRKHRAAVSPFIPAGGLRTRYIIADIQFALYSSTAVAEALSA